MPLTLNRFRYGTGALPPETAPISRMRKAVVLDLPPVGKIWTAGPVLNQKNLGACAAFATTAELIAEPQGQLTVDPKLANAYGVNLFQRARVLSGWPPLPTKGSGNRASHVFRNMEADMARALITNYRFYRQIDGSLEEALHDVVNNGPAVVTLMWYRSFEQTRRNGLMVCDTNGSDRGYHALCLLGFDPAKSLPVYSKKTGRRTGWTKSTPMVLIRNSWGTSWGERPNKSLKRTGNGWLKVSDLQRLFLKDEAYLHTPQGRLPVDLAAVLAANPDPTVS
jgi:hypothetical protein